ncbi:MAG: DUF3343 domain-containing protein [Clostridia bacterium]|nr:DUF3343 domain-containing protein [Clostridia bacterium]
MKYILVVFSSRKDAIGFYETLRRANIYSAVVNTPREVTSSCGVSVKIDPKVLNYVKNAALCCNSFIAFYMVEEFGIKRKILKL